MVSKNEKHDDQEKQRLEFTRLKKRKSVGFKGVKARDLKWTDEKITEWMRGIMQRHHQTRFHDSQLLEKGDDQSVVHKKKRSDEIRKRSNILYLADVVHMFSTMLYNTAQQARQLPVFLTFVGFRKIQTTDHLMAYRLIVRKCSECEQTSGRQRSIFKTPFDSIRHDAILEISPKPFYQ